MKRAHALTVAVTATLSLAAASCSSGKTTTAATTTVAPRSTTAATATTAATTAAGSTAAATTAPATTAATTTTTTLATTQPAPATTTPGTTTGTAIDGLTLAVAAPTDTDGFGKVVAVTTDAAGNPIVAFTNADTTDTAKSDLFVSALDPTTHRYTKPVAVATIAANSNLPLSMAFDPASSSIVVDFEDGTTIGTAVSTDGGATWKTGVAATADETLTHPNVVVLQGNAVLLYSQGNDLHVVSAPLGTNTTPADSTTVVAESGGTIEGSIGGSLATDGTTLGVAFFQDSPTGGGRDLDFWTVGSPASVKVGDTGGQQNDSPSLALAYTSGSPVISASLAVNTFGNSGIFFSASKDRGATFGPLTLLPADNSAGPGFTTSMVTGKGSSAAIAYASNSGSGDAACGQPKLILSVDETAWKTCSPTGADDDVDTNYPALAASNDGRLFAVFTNSSSSALAAGIYVYSIPAVS